MWAGAAVLGALATAARVRGVQFNPLEKFKRAAIEVATAGRDVLTVEGDRFDAPVFEAPTFQAPTFQAPRFEAPSFVNAPSFAPSFSSLNAPSFAAPTFEAPTFQAPTFTNAPTFSQFTPPGGVTPPSVPEPSPGSVDPVDHSDDRIFRPGGFAPAQPSPPATDTDRIFRQTGFAPAQREDNSSDAIFRLAQGGAFVPSPAGSAFLGARAALQSDLARAVEFGRVSGEKTGDAAESGAAFLGEKAGGALVKGTAGVAASSYGVLRAFLSPFRFAESLAGGAIDAVRER